MRRHAEQQFVAEFLMATKLSSSMTRRLLLGTGSATELYYNGLVHCNYVIIRLLSVVYDDLLFGTLDNCPMTKWEKA